MEICFHLCYFRMLTYFCWVSRDLRVFFFCVVTFLYLVSVLFFYLNSVLGPFFYAIPDLNVFDIFTRMGLLQESSNKCGVLSWLSTSTAGL